MQAQDKSVNLDTNCLLAVMLEKSPATMALSALGVGRDTSAAHLKRERYPVRYLDSTHWEEQQNVKTVHLGMPVQTVGRFLSLVY